MNTSISSTNCSDGSFTMDERNNVLVAMGATEWCSFLFCVIAVFMVMVAGLYKHFVYRLAMYQVLASMFLSFCAGLVLMLYNYKDALLYYRVSCKVTAFLIEYSVWVKLLFTIWLTFHLFSYVVFFKNLKRLEWLYISSSVLGPLLIAWIPFIHNSYGLAGAWCFIRGWEDECATHKFNEGIIEQFLLFYAPTVFFLGLNDIAIVTMIVVLVYRACHSRSHAEERPLLLENDQRKELLKQLLPLLTYPIIYFMLMLFPLANRVYMAVSTHVSYHYLLVHAVFISSMGLFAGCALIIHILSVHCLKCRRAHWRSEGLVVNYSSKTMEHVANSLH